MGGLHNAPTRAPATAQTGCRADIPSTDAQGLPRRRSGLAGFGSRLGGCGAALERCGVGLAACLAAGRAPWSGLAGRTCGAAAGMAGADDVLRAAEDAPSAGGTGGTAAVADGWETAGPEVAASGPSRTSIRTVAVGSGGQVGTSVGVGSPARPKLPSTRTSGTSACGERAAPQPQSRPGASSTAHHHRCPGMIYPSPARRARFIDGCPAQPVSTPHAARPGGWYNRLEHKANSDGA